MVSKCFVTILPVQGLFKVYLFHQFDAMWEYYYEEGAALKDIEELSLFIIPSILFIFFLVMFYIIKGLAVCWFIVLLFWGFFSPGNKTALFKEGCYHKGLKIILAIAKIPQANTNKSRQNKMKKSWRGHKFCQSKQSEKEKQTPSLSFPRTCKFNCIYK